LHFRRFGKEIYYFNENSECDFVLREGNRVVEAVQVSRNLKDKETKDREIRGLLGAMKRFNIKKGFILTEEEEDKILIENREIFVVPVWKFLLDYEGGKIDLK
jgi:uncharacterized protein